MGVRTGRGLGWMCTKNGSYCENEKRWGQPGSDQGLGVGPGGRKVWGSWSCGVCKPRIEGIDKC